MRTFDVQDNRWLAEYPWIKDPADLPDNKRVALAMLYSTERRLGKILNMQPYTITKFEIWYKEGSLINSPKRNLTIAKENSKSTPVRIVFNSSANYMGHVLRYSRKRAG